MADSDPPTKPRYESPNEILYGMVLKDQIQNQALASKLPNGGYSSRKGESSRRITRMRFVVCTLAIVSLALGQMSRTIINYCLPSMVDPRMLQTNQSASNGGSCPVKDSFQEEQTITNAITTDILKIAKPANDHLTAYFITTDRPEHHKTSIENPLIVERIYSGRSSLDDSSDDSLLEATGEKFMWTLKEQSMIKGGFFYSYFIFMIMGGRISEIYGAKYVLLICIAGSALINLATPWMASYSFTLLVASRVVMGAIQSPGVPAIYALVNKWLPKSEASIYLPMIKMSLRVGQVLASMATGLILEWSHLFYSFGLLSAVWSVLWILLSTSEPDGNKWVSEGELVHITKDKRKKQEVTTSTANNKTSKKTPWLKIFTSSSVIGLVIAKLAFSFCNNFMTVELPSYLRYVYHASLEETSLITTVMFTIQVPLTVTAGWVAKVMVQKHPFGLSTTAVRKIFQSLANFGSGVTLVMLTLSDCDLMYTGIVLQIMSFFAIFAAGGETMLPSDLSDEYPATIAAIANSVCNLSGIIVPTLTGLVLADSGGSQSRWNIVILSVAAADFFGGLMFCLLVKAEPLDFDNKQNSCDDAEIGTSRIAAPIRIQPQEVATTYQSDLAIQSAKADELMLNTRIQPHAVYRSTSNEDD